MQIISFDCYGTIIDWETGITQALGGLLSRKGIEMSREEILKKYARIEAKLETQYKPYRDILRMVVEEFGKILRVKIIPEESLALVNSLPNWPPFPDSKDALNRIKKKAKIAIISNVDNSLINRTVKNLGVNFDYIITAEDVKYYKPSLKVFEFAHKKFGVSKNDWLHAGQSIYHDIIPAKKYGVRTALIKRRGYGATPAIEGKPDLTFQNLAQLADWVESALK